MTTKRQSSTPYSSMGATVSNTPTRRRSISSPSPSAMAHSLPLALNSDTLALTISFLKPWEVSALSSVNTELRSYDLMSHIQVVAGKFRSPEDMLHHVSVLPRLHCLDLRGNRLEASGLATLAGVVEGSGQLERLDLSGLSMGPATVRALALSLQRSANRRLRSLSLAVNNLGDEGAQALGWLWSTGALPSLESVNLGNCVISHTGMEHVGRGLSHCAGLRSLNVSNNPLGAGVQFLAPALGPQLEHLSIFNALLDGLAIERLVSQWRCVSLHSLNLSWNRIGTHGSRALARCLATSPCLTSLNLSHNYIQGDALPALALAFRSSELRHAIRKLNLGWNPLNVGRALANGEGAAWAWNPNPVGPPNPPQIANNGQAAFFQPAPLVALDPLSLHGSFLRLLGASLADCPNLESLNLSNVELGSDGAAALAEGLAEKGRGCPSLRSLSISWNRIGVKGGAAMADMLRGGACPLLSLLDVSYNVMGDEGALVLALAAMSPLPASHACEERAPREVMLHVGGNSLSPAYASRHGNVPARTLVDALRSSASSSTTAAASSTSTSTSSAMGASALAQGQAVVMALPPSPRPLSLFRTQTEPGQNQNRAQAQHSHVAVGLPLDAKAGGCRRGERRCGVDERGVVRSTSVDAGSNARLGGVGESSRGRGRRTRR